MAKLEESAHKKLAQILADSRCSPAVLAMHMTDESKYVNESFMQYFVNYIIQMGTAKHVPLYLAEVQQQCKTMLESLKELGLTGLPVGREPESKGEYLAV